MFIDSYESSSDSYLSVTKYLTESEKNVDETESINDVDEYGIHNKKVKSNISH